MAPKRKLRSSTSSIDSDQVENEPNKRVAMLVPRTRHISERTVKSKWAPLSEPIQDRIKELFQATELPVLTRQKDGKKRVEAQSALSAVRKKYGLLRILLDLLSSLLLSFFYLGLLVRVSGLIAPCSLGKRLPRMPFPPGTKEISFNYEAALNENRLLESQLATMTSSATLLRREIKREELQLARDTAKLEELEKNAKAAEAQSKKQSKNLDADPDVLSLVKQLRNHLESMQTNAEQVTGIREALTRAQSALSRALLNALPETLDTCFRDAVQGVAQGLLGRLCLEPVLYIGLGSYSARRIADSWLEERGGIQEILCRIPVQALILGIRRSLDGYST
ncbi:conserved hypothetical protein [Uncinocarpus reesii 1704]|uniref:Uncharacterized protein n=1 Tax=Uncinocarpus reesii (strain UAMH 1704) TaxID=336963 RepID=C4JXM6_UNCRE|nr:uncharacterized protein UREG_06399 [Uncinocarpus reesii 1704]EEP81534.1 conserved hypothetical protein [Uncinocarpus reesii 1704]